MRRKHFSAPHGAGRRVKVGWRVNPKTLRAVEAQARALKINPGRLLDRKFGTDPGYSIIATCKHCGHREVKTLKPGEIPKAFPVACPGCDRTGWI